MQGGVNDAHGPSRQPLVLVHATHCESRLHTLLPPVIFLGEMLWRIGPRGTPRFPFTTMLTPSIRTVKSALFSLYPLSRYGVALWPVAAYLLTYANDNASPVTVMAFAPLQIVVTIALE